MAATSTIFWVFSMTQPRIEPWSPKLLVNLLYIMMQLYFLLQSFNSVELGNKEYLITYILIVWWVVFYI